MEKEEAKKKERKFAPFEHFDEREGYTFMTSAPKEEAERLAKALFDKGREVRLVAFPHGSNIHAIYAKLKEDAEKK